MNDLMSLLNEAAVLLPAFLIVFTLMGFCKALASKIMGDPTAQDEGFLSINPLAHMDMIGILVFIAIIVGVGGFFGYPISRFFLLTIAIITGMQWTYNVPVNEYNFRNQALGTVLFVFAGFIGMCLLTLLIFYTIVYIPIGNLPPHVYVPIIEILSTTADLALWFAIIDIIPIPPFDGAKLLNFIIPRSHHDIIDWLEEYSVYIFLFLVLVPGVSDGFFYIINLLSSFLKLGLLYLVI